MLCHGASRGRPWPFRTQAYGESGYTVMILNIIHGAGRRHLTFRLAVLAAGFATIAVFAALYKLDPESYYHVLRFIGVPARHLFIDLHFILASVECWQHGINVYVN